MEERSFESLPDDALVSVGRVRKMLAEARVAAQRRATIDMWVHIGTRDYLEDRPWHRSSRISGRGRIRPDSGG